VRKQIDRELKSRLKKPKTTLLSQSEKKKGGLRRWKLRKKKKATMTRIDPP